MKFCLIFPIFLSLSLADKSKPHIIFIVADDLGWNDVGFHGSNQIATPNIDALAFSGKILNSYYVNPICSPSRSALMTGFHPIHTGMQHGVIFPGEPYGLPLNFTLLPQYLNDLGYESHAVGKWHLGFFKKDYTPIYRGFKSHMGFWNGAEDYYQHTRDLPGVPGYDFRKNQSVLWDAFGTYSTHLYTNESTNIIYNHQDKSQPLFLYLAHQATHAPLQAPQEDIDKYSYIKNKKRRIFAAMLHNIDKSIGAIVQALNDTNMLNNTIIVFTTDNGGPVRGFGDNIASNWPLKGGKDTLWEGGVRGAGFIWSSDIMKSNSRVSNDLMNIQDWLPTLYDAAGGNLKNLPLMDGVNLWPTLISNVKSPRNLMVHNIDDEKQIESIRIGEWKYVKGTTHSGKFDDWFGPSGRGIPNYNFSSLYSSVTSKVLTSIGHSLPSQKNIIKIRKATEFNCQDDNKTLCNPKSSVCLFNITADPCEKNNLALQYPSIVKTMESIIETYRSSAVPPGNKPFDPKSNPKFWGYVWSCWRDNVTSPIPNLYFKDTSLFHFDFIIEKQLESWLLGLKTNI